jgi:formylglycine-generating enzyme required for sulfatase activity
MKTKSILASVLVCVMAAVNLASADTFGTVSNRFTIDFVPISGSTNPTSGYGIVNNDYRMGTYEITNDQWNKFTASLGVPVTGNPANAYDRTAFYTGLNVPTNGVSWYEAAQFVNWLNTSTGHQAAYKFTGTQGTSDYTLATWSASEAASGTNLYRNKDAYYFLPTEDEWVKAAYWNGTTLQDYSNASSADLVSFPGYPDKPDPTKWNYGASGVREPWGVGSEAKELNGTYDMMGNVWEWLENPYNDPSYGTTSNRGWRGGSFDSAGLFLSSSYRAANAVPQSENDFDFGGFRVASEIPEPCTLLLLGLGALRNLKRFPRL